MKNILTLLILALTFSSNAQNSDSLMIRSIYDEVLSNGECYDHLRVLCKDIGARLSGSPEADSAIVWGEQVLNSYSPDRVYLQPVKVPKWTRGNTEIGKMTTNGETSKIAICALGGSVGTKGVIQGEVVEVKNFKQLEELGKENIKGKIVFYNRALDPLLINTGAAYGGAYDQRSDGASEAAAYGAIGTLVRSLTHATDTFPHTGAMRYKDGVKKIPSAGISTVDARRLSQALKDDPHTSVSMEMSCKAYKDVMQANVIAEIKGSEFPDKYIVVGGHLDSWDIGEGAHDDGAGIVQTIEVLRTFKALNYQPKHTIRFVLYINEENGNNGGKTYAAVVEEEGEEHVAAIETDSGGFTPRGFNIEGNAVQTLNFKKWSYLFSDYNLHVFKKGWSGVDIRPLKNDRIALFGLVPDSQRYFDYHHSGNDVFENVNKRELELGAASIASLLFLIDYHGI